MKKLSFLELEKEMAEGNKLIRYDKELDTIKGGGQSNFEQENFGFIANTDQFGFKKTTIVKNGYMTNTQTTVQDGNDYPLNILVHPDTTSITTTIPTTTNPCETDYGRLMDKVNNDFGGEIPANTNFSTEPPPGYSVVTDSNSPYYNKYKHKDSNGDTVYSNAVTQAGYVGHVSPDGTFSQTWVTNIHVSPGAINNSTDQQLHATIGHELVHDNNISQHRDLYNSNRTQFNKNSEYSAWKYEYIYYQSNYLYNSASQAHDKMNYYINQGADTDWDATLPDTTSFPTTTTTYTTTLLPTTTIN